MVYRGPKVPLPFIEMSDMIDHVQQIVGQGPPRMTNADPKVTERFRERVRPISQRARESNGALPDYVFPDVELTT